MHIHGAFVLAVKLVGLCECASYSLGCGISVFLGFHAFELDLKVAHLAVCAGYSHCGSERKEYVGKPLVVVDPDHKPGESHCVKAFPYSGIGTAEKCFGIGFAYDKHFAVVFEVGIVDKTTVGNRYLIHRLFVGKYTLRRFCYVVLDTRYCSGTEVFVGGNIFYKVRVLGFEYFYVGCLRLNLTPLFIAFVRHRGDTLVDIQSFGAVLRTAVNEVVCDSACHAEQYYEHEYAPGNCKSGQKCAQLVVAHGLSYLSYQVKHADRLFEVVLSRLLYG